MKKFVLAASIFLACATTCYAAKFDGGFFQAVLPKASGALKWTSQEIEGGAVALISPKNETVITVQRLEGGDLKSIAVSLSSAHNSRNLVCKDEQGRAYEYTGRVNGKPIYAQVFDAGDGTIGYIAMVGDWQSGQAAGVFNSIVFNPILPEEPEITEETIVSSVAEGLETTEAAKEDTAAEESEKAEEAIEAEATETLEDTSALKEVSAEVKTD